MYSFDPAINYGPNDAGVSAASILLVLVGILVGFLLLGFAYKFATNLIKGNDDEKSD